MVEDRITDGKRIAQLLASELTGLTTAPIDRVGVDDANPDAEPSADGTFAYAIELDGGQIGEVFVHETTARMEISLGADSGIDTEEVDTDGLTVTTTDGGVRIHVEYGAATKRAVDVLATVIDGQS